MFTRQASDIQFIAITFVLVLLLGARTFFSLTEEENLSVESAVASTSVLASTRTPASVPAVSAKKIESALQQFTQVDLNCTKKTASVVSIHGNFVQLQGKSCLKGMDVGAVEITNRSNGYTASIFPRGTDKYQTDLIQLQNGENEIAIRYRERSGKAVEEVIKVHSTKI